MSGASNGNTAPTPDGTLTIAVRPGGQPDAAWTGYTGWTRERVTTGIETCPADFELEATDRYPGAVSEIDVTPGMECQIIIGKTVVLTGYIDRVETELTAGAHTIRISGRSKCADLVDCSAEFSTFQVNNTDPVSLATQLAAPFGITVSTVGDIGTVMIPQFDVVLTETPYEIIERIARYAAILAYDGPDGNLVLARSNLGAAMASGFSQGQNVQQAYGTFSMDERFSTVEAVQISTDVAYTDPGDPANIDALSFDAVEGALAVDTQVPRHRPLIIVAEQGDLSHTLAERRCQWEVNRRAGRSHAVRVVADNWFDSAGTLWTKNFLAPIDIPAAKVTNVQWTIGAITFLRDEAGTRADITLMPPAAFQPEPILLTAGPIAQAFPGGIGAASDGGEGAGGAVPIVTGGAQ